MVPRVDNGQISGYRVLIEMDAEVPMYRQVQIHASAAGINGAAVLEIPELGRRPMLRGAEPHPADAGRLKEGSEIVAVDLPPYRTFVGASTAQPIKSLVNTWFPEDQADSLLGRLRTIGQELPESGREVKKTYDGLVERVRPDLKRWKADFEATQKQASAAFDRIGAGKDASPDALVPQLRTLSDDASTVKRPDQRRAAIAAEAFDRAIASARSLGAKVSSMQSMLDDPDTSAGRAGADFGIASQELAATGEEAITSPWRLVGRPAPLQGAERDRTEIVRAYALAAADYKRAMKGIEDALLRDQALLAQEPALAALLRSRWEAANATFDAWRVPMEDLILGVKGAAKETPAAPPAAAPSAPAAP